LRQLEQQRDRHPGHEDHDLVMTGRKLVEQTGNLLGLDVRCLVNGGHAHGRSAVLLDQTRQLTFHT